LIKRKIEEAKKYAYEKVRKETIDYDKKKKVKINRKY
jgi:hypothetical protein